MADRPPQGRKLPEVSVLPLSISCGIVVDLAQHTRRRGWRAATGRTRLPPPSNSHRSHMSMPSDTQAHRTQSPAGEVIDSDGTELGSRAQQPSRSGSHCDPDSTSAATSVPDDLGADGWVSAARPESRTSVLLLMGAQRSGSTLLASALGTLPGCWNSGESALVWSSRLDGRPCACLRSCADCEVWTHVFEAALGVGSASPAVYEDLHRLMQSHVRVRHLLRLLDRSSRPRSRGELEGPVRGNRSLLRSAPVSHRL